METGLVAPIVDKDLYRWQFGEVSFEVNAAQGARVTAFRIGEQNMLTGPETNGLNFGSTFWPSPQSSWGWPPESEIDSDRYEVVGEGAGVSFISRPGAKLGLSVGKRFEVDAAAETVTARYTLENRGSAARQVAPWEITRVPAGGLTFFPAGEGTFPPSNLGVRETGGIVWFDYDPAPITDHQKLFADGGEGWIAHLDVARAMLLVKTFPEVARDRQAPGEAEIELYADPTHSYVEVEQQGPFAPLAPGEQATWSVTWRLRRLPPGIPGRPGSAPLVALVRALALAPPAR
jgi:hypothetical protein